MSESNSPYSFGGPESAGKPFAAIGSLFSSIGKGGKRNQAFNDTVNLHRQMEQITTEEQGKRQAAAAQTAVGVVKDLRGHTENIKLEHSPDGFKLESSGIKAPKTPGNSRSKSSSKAPGMVGKTPRSAPVKGQTAKPTQAKRPAAKTTVKKVK